MCLGEQDTFVSLVKLRKINDFQSIQGNPGSNLQLHSLKTMSTRHAINTKLRIGEIIHIALYQGLKEGACYDFEKS